MGEEEGTDDVGGEEAGPAQSQEDKMADNEDEVCCPLESLGLGGNQIGDTGAKLLVQALYLNTSE